MRILLALAILGCDGPSSEPLEETHETVKTRGREIAVDIFAPRTAGKHPAIVIVHGAGGAGDGDGRRSGYAEPARRLAQFGYVALVPHYFGKNRPDRKNGRKNARSHQIWEQNVAATISFAAKRADVDPQRIGLLGSSLGSWVALGVAARDRRVAAVVENFGGWPEWEAINPTRLPPVLILHGDADDNVRVEEAYKLDRILQAAGVPHEIQIYPGAGHGFHGDDRADAWRRTLEFFDHYVKRAPAPAAAVVRPPSRGPRRAASRPR
jgi:carboxymethylenebutenolidase